MRRIEEAVIDFVACGPIPAGAELTISYTTTYGDESPLWFEAKN